MISQVSYRERGVGLIEVMVTVLILGTSLLAIASLQTRSLEQNHSAYLRTQANILAYDFIEQIRMASPQPPGALVLPDTAAFSNMLPGGAVAIDCNADRLCTLTVSWADNVRNPDDAQSIFTYSTSL